MRNYYRLLNVHKNAYPQEITAAYEKLKKQALRDLAERNRPYYALLPEVYSILINPVKRQEYDQAYENALNAMPFYIPTAPDQTPAKLPDAFPDGLLNHLYANTNQVLEAWHNEKLRQQIDQWDWVEFALFNATCSEPALGLTLCKSPAIAEWSSHSIFRLAYDVRNDRPEFCLALLDNKAAASHLTGSQLLALAEKFGVIVSSRFQDRLFRFKYLAASHLKKFTPSQLKLEWNEEIEVVNENYILGKCAIYTKQDAIALKYFLLAAQSLHLPSLREIMIHPQSTLEHLKTCLEYCENLDNNSVSYFQIKKQLLKRLLEYFDSESETVLEKNPIAYPVSYSSDFAKTSAASSDTNEHLHFYELLKITPAATATEIQAAYEKIEKESARNSRVENKTYYNEVDKAYAALTSEKTLTLVEKTKQHLDTPFLKKLQDNPAEAVDTWHMNRQKVLQWQWYELFKNNHALALEISSSQTLASWCNFIIFKLASLNAEVCKQVINNVSASILLTGTELCLLAASYPDIKSIITENENLSLKYYAAHIIVKNNHLALKLSSDEEFEKINPYYILAKKFLHENIRIAAIHYLVEALKTGHINSYYQLIHIGNEAEIKFCREACKRYVNNTDVNYTNILSSADQMLLVSVHGQTAKKTFFDELGQLGTLSDNPNAFFNQHKDSQHKLVENLALVTNEERIIFANSPRRSPSPPM